MRCSNQASFGRLTGRDERPFSITDPRNIRRNEASRSLVSLRSLVNSEGHPVHAFPHLRLSQPRDRFVFRSWSQPCELTRRRRGNIFSVVAAHLCAFPCLDLQRLVHFSKVECPCTYGTSSRRYARGIELATDEIRIAETVPKNTIAIAPFARWNDPVSSDCDPSSITRRIAQWWRSHKGENLVFE